MFLQCFLAHLIDLELQQNFGWLQTTQTEQLIILSYNRNAVIQC